MLENYATQINTFIETSKLYIYPWCICFGVLWGINIFYWLTGSKLNFLAIYPRSIIGLLGIIFSPILHQNFSHLFFNSIPLFALGLALLAAGLGTFLKVTAVVTLLGGFGVWLLGRKALHMGASGLVSGYFGYILVAAFTNPSIVNLLLAIVVFYYFGSIFLGIFPREEKVSWESHLYGFLAGVFYALAPAKFWIKWPIHVKKLILAHI